MSYSDPLIQHIEQRTRRRSRFAVHAALYLGYAVASIMFLISPDFWRQFMTLPNAGDVLLILMVWTPLFVAHLVHFRIQEIGDRQLQGLYSALPRPEKSKRDHGA